VDKGLAELRGETKGIANQLNIIQNTLGANR
jgi:hypothetical protein